MPATEKQQPDLAVPAKQRHGIGEGDVGRRRLDLFQLLLVGTSGPDLLRSRALAAGSASDAARASRSAICLGSAATEIDEDRLVQEVAGQLPSGEFVADDVHARTEHLIAVGVIEMEMRVDEEAHRLVGECVDLLEHDPRGFWRDVRVDYHHVVRIDDDRGVGSDVQRTGAHGAVDARADLLKAIRRRAEPQAAARGRGRVRWRRRSRWR